VARVRAAADELGYQPNAVARSLRTQKTALWMLLISDIENPFFTAVARGVEDVAQAAGYSLALCNSDEDLDKERSYITGALNERAAGVLIAPAGPGTDVQPLLDRGVPVVAFDRLPTSGDLDSVVTASRLAAREATEHLLEQGWQRVACVSGPRGAATATERTLGYNDAVVGRDRSPWSRTPTTSPRVAAWPRPSSWTGPSRPTRSSSPTAPWRWACWPSSPPAACSRGATSASSASTTRPGRGC
jgi:LacI family transcriptional regulator